MATFRASFQFFRFPDSEAIFDYYVRVIAPLHCFKFLLIPVQFKIQICIVYPSWWRRRFIRRGVLFGEEDVVNERIIILILLRVVTAPLSGKPMH